MSIDVEPTEPLPGVHRGREVCRDLLRRALVDLALALDPATAAGAPIGAPRDIWLVDRQFGDWPLDDADVIDSLNVWLRSGGRCLHLVGLDFEATARALPRFARWRRDWSHAIDVRRPVDGQLPASLRGLFAGGTAWQWLDAPDWRLRVLSSTVPVRTAHEQLADFLQHCEPAWAVTTLGL